MPPRNLELEGTIILFDRDLGLSIFQNFRCYDDLVDDAEWLLERTMQKSRGFLIRPISNSRKVGLWIGEYTHGSNRIINQECLFDRNSSLLGKLITNYTEHKSSEKNVVKSLALDQLKRKIRSNIIKHFKYYLCPLDRFYYSCNHIQRMHETLMKEYEKGDRIPYSTIVKTIAETMPCDNVVVCPLMVPNSFEKVLNLRQAFKARKLGDVQLVSSDMVVLY